MLEKAVLFSADTKWTMAGSVQFVSFVKIPVILSTVSL